MCVLPKRDAGWALERKGRRARFIRPASPRPHTPCKFMRARAAPRPNIDPSRFRRWVTFAWLWLLRYAAFLCFGDASGAALWRRRARRAVRDLILIRAAALMPVRPERRRRRRAPPPGWAYAARPASILRAACGSYVRRRLRARSPGHALAALFRALQDMEALARAIVKRLPRGLTRTRPLVLTRACGEPLSSQSSAPAPIADTS